jgi:aminoglycoside 3-N-acetyltransferase
VPGQQVPQGTRPVTRSELVVRFRALGVREGAILMVHTRMSALGWVVGGEDALVLALVDVLGPAGTLAAYAGWDADPFHLASWPDDWQRAYQAELPPYDPAVTAANHGHGRLPERIRTWPGAVRGEHPEQNLVAVGPRAAWLVSPHPFDDACGPDTPLARLVEAGGQVLMLGAPLETLTLLHHAEALADVPNKRRVTYRMPILRDGVTVWVELHDIDTSLGAFPYERVVPDGVDAFEVIAREALEAGVGTAGRVGEAECYLFDAASLVRFAVGWMEDRFRS